MKNQIRLALLVTLLMLPLAANAQSKTGWSKEVTVVASKGKETVSVEGDLSKGKILEDLDWASTSSNACFPATQNEKFRGNHVFYATTLPPRSIMKISVKPSDESANLSLYGYMMGANSFDIVPDLSRCITCEADHKWDRPWKGKVQTSERKIEFQNPTQNTYNIFIGVAAPKGVTTGKYTVEITTES